MDFTINLQISYGLESICSHQSFISITMTDTEFQAVIGAGMGHLTKDVIQLSFRWNEQGLRVFGISKSPVQSFHQSYQIILSVTMTDP